MEKLLVNIFLNNDTGRVGTDTINHSIHNQKTISCKCYLHVRTEHMNRYAAIRQDNHVPEGSLRPTDCPDLLYHLYFQIKDLQIEDSP